MNIKINKTASDATVWFIKLLIEEWQKLDRNNLVEINIEVISSNIIEVRAIRKRNRYQEYGNIVSVKRFDTTKDKTSDVELGVLVRKDMV